MCFSITSDNIVIGIVMLMATVAIREEVKKQPLLKKKHSYKPEVDKILACLPKP